MGVRKVGEKIGTANKLLRIHKMWNTVNANIDIFHIKN